MNGQAKIDFEKWLKQQPFVNYNKYTKQIIIHNKVYSELNKRFQHALIIEFFDSVGIIITINYWTEASYTISNKNGGKDLYSGLCGKTRQEATEKAIEKAVEIYNNLK